MSSPPWAAWESSSSGLFEVELEHYERMEGRCVLDWWPFLRNRKKGQLVGPHMYFE
jgi:hypothetical protein